jgi:glutaredoxin-like YruB-family protein
MVKVFSTKVCSYCVTLKEFLKQHNVEYEEIDVGEDEEGRKEMIEKSGQMGVPVLEINGQIVVGFDKVRILELLEIEE